tara:strand:- start:7836 stop:8450 length:615 start_codon:yes stop_codon:yes gene_type:complete
MAIDPSRYKIDPFSRAIPGQSLTATPGQAPYERPPRTSSVENALGGVLESMHKPIQKESLLRLLETGLSAETISSGIVMKAFSDGMITPDMAELMKPVLVLAVMGIANDAGVKDVKVLNTPAPLPISFNMVEDLVDRMGGTEEEIPEEEGDDDQDSMMFDSIDEGMPEEIDMNVEQGFINRNAEEPAGFIEQPPQDIMMDEERV